jgi:hypothetical protein
MLTAAAVHRMLSSATATVLLRDVCVLLAPVFAGNTVGAAGGERVRAAGAAVVAAA